MRRQAAHGVEGHRVAGDGVVVLAPGIGPRDGQLDLLVACGDAHLVGEALDRRGGNAGEALGPLRRVVLDALLQELEGRLHRRAVGEPEFAEQEGIAAFGVGDHRLVGGAVPPQLVLRIEAALLLRHLGAQEHAELVALLVEVHQLAGVGVAHQEVAVVEALGDDLVDDRQQQCAVGARADRHPLVGDGRVAGAHRVDRDEAAAVALEFRQRDLHRVGVVVLRRADHDEELGAVEVRPAELPEGAADGIDHAGGHVHRAEAAVRRVIGRAELAREEAGQRLHLISAREQGEFLGVVGADLRQALGQDREGLLPGDRLERAFAAFTARLAQQRFRQPRRRVLLHDAGAALGADHALVERVIRISVDVAHLPVDQMHADAAAAGTHVAGGFFHLLDRCGWFGHGWGFNILVVVDILRALR
ncbi:MAG: hypothetical protein MOGDAGHF_02816 [Rhodocyclaceae bacterium]|nr:hypothetical protein [Rhodocyclaceae bacterium]